MSVLLNKIKNLCKLTFDFSNMNTFLLDQTSHIRFEYGLNKIPEILNPYFTDILDYLSLLENDFEYHALFHTTSYKLNYVSAKVFDNEYLGSIITGPYLLEKPTILMVESIISENKISLSLKDIIYQYYLSLPVISTYEATSIASFLSFITSTFHSYDFEKVKIGDLTYNYTTDFSVPNPINQNIEQAMETADQRYKLENEMLHAVETGNIGLFKNIIRENPIMSKIPYRIPNDPLRSLKNQGFVLNTLLRKAAEKGGLSPLYLDSISAKYSIQIEKCSSIHELMNLYYTIQLDYCESVRRYSNKEYTYRTKKAIEYIRFNLDQTLNLSSIASALNISSSELSRTFKKETGESITEFINKMRINEALHLLNNEDIPITQIAYMVGYNDINYFTKVFKKLKNITPSNYRKSKAVSVN